MQETPTKEQQPAAGLPQDSNQDDSQTGTKLETQNPSEVRQCEEATDKTESLQLDEEKRNKGQAITTDAKTKSEVDSANKYMFYVYGGNYPETIRDAMQRRGNWTECVNEEEAVEKCHFVWKPFNYNAEGYKRIDKRVVRSNTADCPLIFNHFEVLKGLVTKTGLVRSLKQYYFQNESARQASYQAFDSTPTSFLVTQGMEDSESQDFIQRYRDISKGYAPKEKIPMKHCANNIWLVKPAACNQGRGIEIFTEFNDITRFINTRPRQTCWVVQKYIERPLLFRGRKFDIRVWAFVNQKQDIFMFKEGYLRTSSDDYSLSNENNYVHLTNNCLQKFGDNYGKHEEGNTVGFDALQRFFDEVYPELAVDVREHLVPRMKDLIIDTIQSVKTQLNPNQRKNVFELFGYDFLIDEDLRIWLIEVNTNPYFGVPNPFIANLLPKMMDDLLAHVVDPIYTPATIPSNCKSTDGFELIFSEGKALTKGGPLIGSVNQRRPFGHSLYPIKSLRQDIHKKTVKSDMKNVNKFRQNISICSARPTTAVTDLTYLAAPRKYPNQLNAENKANSNDNTNNGSSGPVPNKEKSNKPRFSQVQTSSSLFRRSSTSTREHIQNSSNSGNHLSNVISKRMAKRNTSVEKVVQKAPLPVTKLTPIKEAPKTIQPAPSAKIVSVIQQQVNTVLLTAQNLQNYDEGDHIKQKLLEILTFKGQYIDGKLSLKDEVDNLKMEAVLRLIIKGIRQEELQQNTQVVYDNKLLKSIIDSLELLRISDQVSSFQISSNFNFIERLLDSIANSEMQPSIAIKMKKLTVKRDSFRHGPISPSGIPQWGVGTLGDNTYQGIGFSFGGGRIYSFMFMSSTVFTYHDKRSLQICLNLSQILINASDLTAQGLENPDSEITPSNACFEFGIVSAFQMAQLKNDSSLQQFIKAKLLQFFNKKSTIKQQLSVLKQNGETAHVNDNMQDFLISNILCNEEKSDAIVTKDPVQLQNKKFIKEIREYIDIEQLITFNLDLLRQDISSRQSNKAEISEQNKFPQSPFKTQEKFKPLASQHSILGGPNLASGNEVYGLKGGSPKHQNKPFLQSNQQSGQKGDKTSVYANKDYKSPLIGSNKIQSGQQQTTVKQNDGVLKAQQQNRSKSIHYQPNSTQRGKDRYQGTAMLRTQNQIQNEKLRTVGNEKHKQTASLNQQLEKQASYTPIASNSDVMLNSFAPHQSQSNMISPRFNTEEDQVSTPITMKKGHTENLQSQTNINSRTNLNQQYQSTKSISTNERALSSGKQQYQQLNYQSMNKGTTQKNFHPFKKNLSISKQIASSFEAIQIDKKTPNQQQHHYYNQNPLDAKNSTKYSQINEGNVSKTPKVIGNYELRGDDKMKKNKANANKNIKSDRHLISLNGTAITISNKQ